MCSFLKWNSLDFAAMIGHVSHHPVYLNLSLHSALHADKCVASFSINKFNTHKFCLHVVFLPYFEMGFKLETEYFVLPLL